MRDAAGRTPLHEAAASDNSYFLKKLLENFPEFDVNFPGEDDEPPLLAAARNDRVENIKLLLQANADINATDKYQYTALHEGIRNNKIDTIMHLLESGANSNTKHQRNRTPLDSAITVKNVEIIKLLLTHDFSIAKMYSAEEQEVLLAKVENNQEIKSIILEYVHLEKKLPDNIDVMNIEELQALQKSIAGEEDKILTKKEVKNILHIQERINIKNYPSGKKKFAHTFNLNGLKVINIDYPALFLYQPEQKIKDKTISAKLFFLPAGKDKAEIINKIMTELLYEAQRHDWHDPECRTRRKVIIAINPLYKNYTKEQFQNVLKKNEKQNRDFFFDYMSDDSDDESEKSPLAKKVKDKYTTLSNTAGSQIFFKKLESISKEADTITKDDASERADKILPRKHLGARATLCHSIRFSENQIMRAEDDLVALNRHLKNGMPIEKAIKRIKTTFYVAQYRGIGYDMRWNRPSRQVHRKEDETRIPIYAASVYEAVNFGLFRHYDAQKHQSPALQGLLKIIGEKLLSMQLEMAETEEYASSNYQFDNLSEYAQDFYAKKYSDFHQSLVDGELSQYRGKYFLNSANPKVSTGDRPHHAIAYALQNKFYSGFEGRRLRPCYRKNGRAAFPYMGKVYVSLHPLSDYSQDKGTFHMPTLVRQAKSNLDNIILAERETTFTAVLPEERVIHQFIARYPSFDKPYKQYYLIKYGFNEEMYDLFAKLIKSSAPHSDLRRYTKKILSNWLIAFSELKLIKLAVAAAAEKNNGFLVYQNCDGGFTMQLPAIGVRKSAERDEEYREITVSRASRAQPSPPVPGYSPRS